MKAAKTEMEKNTDHRLAPEPGAKNARPVPKKAAEYQVGREIGPPRQFIILRFYAQWSFGDIFALTTQHQRQHHRTNGRQDAVELVGAR